MALHTIPALVEFHPNVFGSEPAPVCPLPNAKPSKLAGVGFLKLFTAMVLVIPPDTTDTAPSTVAPVTAAGL